MTKGPNKTEEKQDCAAGLEEDPKDVDVICNITEAILTEVGRLAGCPCMHGTIPYIFVPHCRDIFTITGIQPAVIKVASICTDIDSAFVSVWTVKIAPFILRG